MSARFDLRDYQRKAVAEILAAYAAGHKDVILDAPTGSGKTVIATAVMDSLNGGIYAAANLALQDQYAADFPEAAVIRGHRNYDCPGSDCYEPMHECRECDSDHEFSLGGLTTHMVEDHDLDPRAEAPWLCQNRLAKHVALASWTVNANPWYLGREFNGPGWFSGQGLAVYDEADAMGGVLDTVFGGSLSIEKLKRHGWTYPDDKAPYSEVVSGLWRAFGKAYDLADALRRRGREADAEQARADATAIESTARHLADMAGLVEVEWDAREIKVAYVEPSRVAYPKMWGHTKRRLFMSASIGSPESWARYMGIADPFIVSVPHPFPLANRLVKVERIARMNSAAWNDPRLVQRMARAIQDRREGRTLVHVTAGRQAEKLAEFIPGAITYENGRPEDKERAVAEYLDAEGSILIGQSLHRGLDLDGEKCRTNIVAKVPFPPLNRLARARGVVDPDYYARATAGVLTQALGRGVRTPDDHCASYVLDSAFHDGITRHTPAWLQEALV